MKGSTPTYFLLNSELKSSTGKREDAKRKREKDDCAEGKLDSLGPMAGTGTAQ